VPSITTAARDLRSRGTRANPESPAFRRVNNWTYGFYYNVTTGAVIFSAKPVVEDTPPSALDWKEPREMSTAIGCPNFEKCYLGTSMPWSDQSQEPIVVHPDKSFKWIWVEKDKATCFVEDMGFDKAKLEASINIAFGEEDNGTTRNIE
jgi:hypothetical protein